MTETNKTGIRAQMGARAREQVEAGRRLAGPAFYDRLKTGQGGTPARR